MVKWGKQRDFFSGDYIVWDEDRPVAEIRRFSNLITRPSSLDMVAPWGENGEFTIDGDLYCLRRTNFFRGTFTLELDSQAVATARKRSVFRRAFEVNWQERQYRLQPLAWDSSNFGFYRNEDQIGAIRVHSGLSVETEIDLPDELPVPVQVFLDWLVRVIETRGRVGGPVRDV